MQIWPTRLKFFLSKVPSHVAQNPRVFIRNYSKSFSTFFETGWGNFNNPDRRFGQKDRVSWSIFEIIESNNHFPRSKKKLFTVKFLWTRHVYCHFGNSDEKVLPEILKKFCSIFEIINTIIFFPKKVYFSGKFVWTSGILFLTNDPKFSEESPLIFSPKVREKFFIFVKKSVSSKVSLRDVGCKFDNRTKKSLGNSRKVFLGFWKLLQLKVGSENQKILWIFELQL